MDIINNDNIPYKGVNVGDIVRNEHDNYSLIIKNRQEKYTFQSLKGVFVNFKEYDSLSDLEKDIIEDCIIYSSEFYGIKITLKD